MLDILDFLVDKGNMNIWSSISSKKFFQGLLDLLRTKDIPEVQMKLLGLIQKWGLNFEDKKSALPNFFSVYNKLRMNNVQFPSNYESNYQVYIDNDNINKKNYDKNSDEDNKEEESDKEDNEIFYYMDSLKDVLKVPNFEHKYRRLVNFLVKMHDNIQMANLLIDNREHGGLKEIINTLREGNNTLIDTIQGGRLKDEKLMEITLGTTEDINQTLGRDEDIKNGYKPNKFKSYFVVNNVIRIKNNNHRMRAKSTKPKKNMQRNQEKYGIENNYYDKNKYKEKMGKPKNVDDIFDLFSASNPNNEPQYFQNNRGNNNNINSINNLFNSSQTQQLRNNPMNNFFNNSNRGNNMNNNMNNRNNNTMFFNQNNNQYNQPRPVMTNFDILEQKLNNLNLEQNQNNNYINNTPNMPNMSNMQFNQGYNNNNNNNNNNNRNNNLMSMLDQLGPGPQNNSNQLVPYIGSFNNQNNNNNNMNNQNNFMGNNQYNNNFGNSMNNNMPNNMNNNNQYNNNNRNLFNSMAINRGNNMQINNNDNQMNMNRINMSQNMGNNNNWMNQNNNQNNQQMSFEEMQKQQRLKELDDLF